MADYKDQDLPYVEVGEMRKIRPYAEIWCDGSVTAEGWAGYAFVMKNHRDQRKAGACFRLRRRSSDIIAVELQAIDRALAEVLSFAARNSSRSFEDAHVIVWSDCMDAVDEVRYVVGGHAHIPLTGAHRRGFIQPDHPDLTSQITDTIRSLKVTHGITASVAWQRRMATVESKWADEGAKYGAKMAAKFAGASSHLPNMYALPRDKWSIHSVRIVWALMKRNSSSDSPQPAFVGCQSHTTGGSYGRSEAL